MPGPKTTSSRKNTAEEIRQLDASQSLARRGLLALAAGALCALGLVAAVLFPRQPGGAPQTVPDAPQVELTAEPAPADPTPEPPGTPRLSRPGTGRRRDPIASLAAPKHVEVPRPAGASGPHLREQDLALEDLARSLAAQKKGAVQLCYEHELKRDPGVRGSVTVSLELKAPRRVQKVAVRDTLQRPGFTRCVRSAMGSLELPALREDVVVELPFALKAPQL